MPLVPCKCTNCGSTLTVDSAKDAAICEFCGSAFVVEKAINNYNCINNITAQVVNIYDKEEDFIIRAGELIEYNGASADVIIPDSVTHIGSKAFAFCSALKSIKIPNTVVCIGEEAFVKCESLSEICIPNGVVEIKNGAFKYCNNLNKVNIGNSVVNIHSEAFFGCCSLTHIYIPDCVTFLGSEVFSYCINLLEVRLSENLTCLHYGTFASCYNLKNIILPNSIVEISSNCFDYCEKLSSVTFGNNINTICGDVFYKCEQLTNIVLPDSVKVLECITFGPFRECSIVEFKVPKGVTELGQFTFFNCSKLKKVYIHDYVDKISPRAFYDCQNLTEIIASEEWKRAHWDAHPLLYSYKPTDIVEEKEERQGCYIATAVYGSYDCPQVWTLRRFRDNTLDKSFAGRLFIRIYYAISPALVKVFGDKDWFRMLWFKPLDRFVRTLQEKGYEDTPYEDLY